MTLNNINTLRKDRGFTIVELLIVIVVIAILAAITIVAYNGIQNRAKTSSAQAAGNVVVKKAEAANATGSVGYPAATTDFSANAESSLAGSGVTLAATASGTSTVIYQKCGTPAAGKPAQQARVGYFDTTANTTVYSYLGGSAAADCTTWSAALTGGPY